MSQTIKLKKSSVSGNQPDPGTLEYGELAINFTDGKLYFKTNTNSLDYFPSISNVTVQGWQKITTNYTAINGDKLLADSTAGIFNITLPASPSLGASVAILDGGDWKTNNVTVLANGSLIENTNTDVVLNIKGIRVDFIFDGTSWQVYAATGPEELPDQTGNSGKYLTTNGSSASWSTVDSFTSNNYSIATTDTSSIDTWNIANYRSSKYIIQVTQGSNYQVSELLVIHNGTNTFLNEYAVVRTNGSLCTFSTDILAGSARLLVTMNSAANTSINVLKILVSI